MSKYTFLFWSIRSMFLFLHALCCFGDYVVVNGVGKFVFGKFVFCFFCLFFPLLCSMHV